MWDLRYSSDDFAYGTEPNDFLVDNLNHLLKGKVLCLAEGEGRNAVWLAQQGMDVTAVDASAVGLNKAQKLAFERGVSMTTTQSDLKHFDFGSNQWDSIVSIFCHLPPDLRQHVHAQCVEALKPGGTMLLEAFIPRQLEFNTGGPPVIEMMMDSASLQQELQGLQFIHLEETVRDIQEGEFHNGQSAVVQLIAMKAQQ